MVICRSVYKSSRNLGVRALKVTELLNCVVECARSYIHSLVQNLEMGHAFGYTGGKLKHISELMREKNIAFSGLDFFFMSVGVHVISAPIRAPRG